MCTVSVRRRRASAHVLSRLPVMALAVHAIGCGDSTAGGSAAGGGGSRSTSIADVGTMTVDGTESKLDAAASSSVDAPTTGALGISLTSLAGAMITVAIRPVPKAPGKLVCVGSGKDERLTVSLFEPTGKTDEYASFLTDSDCTVELSAVSVAGAPVTGTLKASVTGIDAVQGVSREISAKFDVVWEKD
jgi:hypothetical protein